MIRKVFCTAMLCAVTVSFLAQGVQGNVFGETEPGKKESLIGAVIIWKDTRSGTVTDANGAFSIGVPPGASHLIVSFAGFVSDTIAFSGQNNLQVTLKPVTLGAVNVVGEIGATHINTRDPQLFQVLNEKELCKAACCNLSESFETNASVDATFADAITGTRQIRMLGLDGRYTQMMFDNMPAVRGLASTYGLTYVPGPWVKSIYIAKGVGSVTGGYESITGQINVAMKNPDNADRFLVNAYAGSGGRTELNLIWRPGDGHDHEEDGEEEHAEEEHHHEEGVHFHPVILAHGAMSQLRTDMNGDGFMDNPLFSNILLRNEWHLETSGGLGGQYTINYIRLNTMSGKLEYDPADEIRSQLWGAKMTTERYEFNGKTGYVFSEKPWKSFGSQVSASWHDQEGKYGYRNYFGQQLSARANLLFASRIGSDAHKFTTGFSWVYDDYTESLTFSGIPPVNLSSMHLNRIESVPGVFLEYTLNPSDAFTLVAGIRADQHNIYGTLITPRLHARVGIGEMTSIKLIGGRGYRTANVLMDNVGVLAGNRNIVLDGNDPKGIYGMKMEDAWNTGTIIIQKFKLNHREATLSIDAYHTEFNNQVVVDLETPTIARFYNLEGRSFSNSVQAEMQWTPFKRFDLRLAYRWLEARTDYRSGLLDRPLVNKHRAFTNIAYETKTKENGAQWRFDATLQWISPKRIPYTGEHAEHGFQESTWSQDYFQVMAQVTYVFRKNMEIYVGGENLTNFIVHHAIILAEDPSSEFFDGSLVWGPVFGRMGYVGFRWSL